jgi:DNA primase
MVENYVDYQPILDILEDIFGDPKLHNTSDGQISFDCPVCSFEIKGLDVGDGKGNLEINYKKEVYKCWSCAESHNTHGGLYTLIKKFGNPRHLKMYLLLKPEETEELKVRFYKKVKLPKEYVALTDIRPGFKLTPQYKQAINYLKKRNVTDEIIKKFNIGYCYQGDYANRIIIPSYDEDYEINYFIARSYFPNTKLKYKNPKAEKDIIIFNEHLINWDDTIYIVEGVFDSIFLPNAIPMLGKHMSEKLFNKLYNQAKEIIIVLDGDAWDNSYKLYHALNCGKLMGKVWVVKLPADKDIADLRGDLSEYIPKKID